MQTPQRILLIWMGLILMLTTTAVAQPSPAGGGGIRVTAKKSTPGNRLEHAVMTISVEAAGAPLNNVSVLYFLDDRFVEQFDGVSLPFVFERDFRGQVAGAHVIRIEIEDREEVPLAQGQANIQVRPAPEVRVRGLAPAKTRNGNGNPLPSRRP